METIAIKQLSKEKKGNLEIITKEIILIEDFTFKEITDFLYDIGMLDDCEEAYFSYGVAITFGDEICSINVDKLIEGLKNGLENPLDEDEGDAWKDEKKEWIEKLNKYQGYEIEERDMKNGDKE